MDYLGDYWRSDWLSWRNNCPRRGRFHNAGVDCGWDNCWLVGNEIQAFWADD